MTRLAVLTPSYAPDFELCFDLHRSVLAYAPEAVHHHIVVPRRDLGLFGQLRGPRTHVHCEAEFLPRSFLPLPGAKFSVNLRRPFPPLRGWILQQVLKLAAASMLDADVVVLVDSDIEFIRPFTPATFAQAGVVRFYRKPDEIDERLPRHLTWHRVARQLLGLPPAEPPYPDYVSSLLAWDPAILRELLARVFATSLLRVDPVRRLRRRGARHPGELIRVPGHPVSQLLGRDTAGRRDHRWLPGSHPTRRRRRHDLGEVAYAAGRSPPGAARPVGCESVDV
jgi:hypothetical protein